MIHSVYWGLMKFIFYFYFGGKYRALRFNSAVKYTWPFYALIGTFKFNYPFNRLSCEQILYSGSLRASSLKNWLSFGPAPRKLYEEKKKQKNACVQNIHLVL